MSVSTFRSVVSEDKPACIKQLLPVADCPWQSTPIDVDTGLAAGSGTGTAPSVLRRTGSQRSRFSYRCIPLLQRSSSGSCFQTVFGTCTGFLPPPSPTGSEMRSCVFEFLLRATADPKANLDAGSSANGGAAPENHPHVSPGCLGDAWVTIQESGCFICRRWMLLSVLPCTAPHRLGHSPSCLPSRRTTSANCRTVRLAAATDSSTATSSKTWTGHRGGGLVERPRSRPAR